MTFFGSAPYGKRGPGPNLMQRALASIPRPAQQGFDMQALLGSGMLQSPAAAQFMQSVFGPQPGAGGGPPGFGNIFQVLGQNRPHQPMTFPGGGLSPIALGAPGFGGFGGDFSGKGGMGGMGHIPGWQMGLLADQLGGMSKPGPAPSPFLGLNKFMGPFGNGGGSLVPQLGGQGGGNKFMAQLPVFRGALF